jgi:hypothetical protein
MRLFTVEEAEALLPSLRETLAAMQACKREIDAVRAALADAAGHSAGNGHVANQDELANQRRRAEALVDELNTHLASINEQGVELKDLDQGLLDFPSERDGRVVYLCWKLGEDRIGWWHEVEAGFAGRQPI